MLEAYFDESERDSGAFAVAGYGFAPEQARAFDREWREMLGPISAFHMTDVCARKREFKHFTRSDSDSLIARAVEIVTKYISVAVAFSCNRTEFEAGAVDLRGIREPYSYLCHLCMQEIGNWMRDVGDDGGVAYVFEAGHQFSGEASDLMQLAAGFQEIGTLYCYNSHSFKSKNDSTPLHAADLLAWEWTKYRDETVDRTIRDTRKSLGALWDTSKYRVRHLTGEKLQMLYEPMRQMREMDGIEATWQEMLNTRRAAQEG